MLHTSPEKRATLTAAWKAVAARNNLNDRQLRVVKALRDRFGGHLFQNHGDSFSRTLHLYGVRYTEQNEPPYITPFTVSVVCAPQTRHALIDRGVLEVIDGECRLAVGIVTNTEQDLDDKAISAIIDINQGRLKDEWAANKSLSATANVN